MMQELELNLIKTYIDLRQTSRWNWLKYLPTLAGSNYIIFVIDTLTQVQW